MKYAPHDYQVKATEFLHKSKHSLLMADMGTGKTAIVLSLLHRLFANLETKGVLIIAPLRVCELTWPMEIAKWDFSSQFTHTFIHGKDKEARIKSKKSIYLINYDGIGWLFEYLKTNPCPFDTIVFDEISKLKSPSTKRFKMVKKLLPLFDRRIGLTGTPAPNSYLDLFSEMYCIDGGKALGKYITRFRSMFFDQSWNGFTFTIKKGAEGKIDKLIAPSVFRIKSKSNVPITYTDINVQLFPDVLKDYKKLEAEKLLEFDDAVVNGVNAAVLLNKLRQYTGGAIYAEDRAVLSIHSGKIAAVGKLRGPLIVCYAYKHELMRLTEHFPDSVDFSKGNQKQILEDWNKGKIKRLLIHPASAAHGLNLQSGGCKLVWFTLPWSLEEYLQANARIWRQGQKNPVEIMHLMVPNTVDVLVKAVLESKDNRQKALLDAMGAYRKTL